MAGLGSVTAVWNLALCHQQRDRPRLGQFHSFISPSGARNACGAKAQQSCPAGASGPAEEKDIELKKHADDETCRLGLVVMARPWEPGGRPTWELGLAREAREHLPEKITLELRSESGLGGQEASHQRLRHQGAAGLLFGWSRGWRGSGAEVARAGRKRRSPGWCGCRREERTDKQNAGPSPSEGKPHQWRSLWSSSPGVRAAWLGLQPPTSGCPDLHPAGLSRVSACVGLGLGENRVCIPNTSPGGCPPGGPGEPGTCCGFIYEPVLQHLAPLSLLAVKLFYFLSDLV